jgi:hypothetical protein
MDLPSSTGIKGGHQLGWIRQTELQIKRSLVYWFQMKRCPPFTPEDEGRLILRKAVLFENN